MPPRGTPNTPTVRFLLDAGEAYLLRHGVPQDEARTQTEILTAETLGIPESRLPLEGARPVPPDQTDALRRLLVRRAAGEPVQYLVGHWPFHDIELKTDARALIPRPETELLVERILQSPEWATARDIVDIGTGTGAIILSLAHADRTHPHPSGPRHFTAVDLSPDALTLARENAETLSLTDRVTFIHGDACDTLERASADIIVSNPPYIPTAETDALPDLILKHEPRLALDGGKDGLNILRRITAGATQVLRPNGRLFFEIGDGQGLSVQRILDCSGYTRTAIIRDYAGHDRFAEGSLA